MSPARRFAKFQGLGNDFILIDNRFQKEPIFTPAEAVTMCNRNFGIGGDGVIFALPGSNGCDYTMRIFNSDGSEPQMCGNGIRCLAKYLMQLEEKKTSGSTSYRIWTNAGIISPKINVNGTVTVDMGEPVFTPEFIPTTLVANARLNQEKGDEDSEYCDEVVKDAEVFLSIDESAIHKYLFSFTTLRVTPVSMGNPHAVSRITLLCAS